MLLFQTMTWDSYPGKNEFYYILTAKPEHAGWISPGSIGYKTENPYSNRKNENKNTVHIKFIENINSADILLDVLQKLTKQKAEFLLALECSDRLVELVRSESLDQAVDLVVGSEVTVEHNDKWLKGVVKYIGSIIESQLSSPIAGVWFGIELQVRNFVQFIF